MNNLKHALIDKNNIDFVESLKLRASDLTTVRARLIDIERIFGVNSYTTEVNSRGQELATITLVFNDGTFIQLCERHWFSSNDDTAIYDKEKYTSWHLAAKDFNYIDTYRDYIHKILRQDNE